MKVLRQLLILATLLHVSVVWSQEFNVSPNLPQAATQVAKKIAQKLKSHQPNVGHMGIAVLAFGDEKRKITAQMGNLSTVMQGEIIKSLKEAIKKEELDKFDVLRYSQIENVFKGTSPLGLTDKDPSAAREVLEEIDGVDIAVVGHFKFNGSDTSVLPKKLTISSTIVLPNTTEKVTHQVFTSDIKDLMGDGTDPDEFQLENRIVAEIYALPKGYPLLSSVENYTKLPLKLCKDHSSKFFGKLVLVIDKDKYEGRPYFIKLINTGEPFHPASAEANNEPYTIPDKNRLFSVSAYVDGVSVFYNKVITAGVVTYEKDIRHPAYVSRPILTGKGQRYSSNGSNPRLGEGTIVSTSGTDGSTWTVRGFIRANLTDPPSSTADLFLFGTAEDSIGAEFSTGNRSQIGLISLFTYTERLSSDQTFGAVAEPEAGTEPGPTIPFPLVKTSIQNYHQEIYEVLQIFYRYSDSDSLPMDPDDLVPFEPN
ncbi:Hypothetical protein PBC10988_33640 [Planctomycetales bacterium 10988]|nr:Hypothetical protein PBC10988_33640 [Planctomycetales bacterium 10988]